ncbi:hypothetical protein T492DRAFT_1125714 [Pavlovales sp. CCMP2436]|nr:hypothetical protein T492DRAFT_1125714 [Pavlovales sp. CCMP2436]
MASRAIAAAAALADPIPKGAARRDLGERNESPSPCPGNDDTPDRSSLVPVDGRCHCRGTGFYYKGDTCVRLGPERGDAIVTRLRGEAAIANGEATPRLPEPELRPPAYEKSGGWRGEGSAFTRLPEPELRPPTNEQKKQGARRKSACISKRTKETGGKGEECGACISRGGARVWLVDGGRGVGKKLWWWWWRGGVARRTGFAAGLAHARGFLDHAAVY